MSTEQIVREAGALASAMGGIDGIVFTAGIGEHSAMIRARVALGLRWLGLELDEAANARHGPLISVPASRIKALVEPTDEELMIARHALDVIGRSGSRGTAGVGPGPLPRAGEG
jgi:acetate kinase